MPAPQHSMRRQSTPDAVAVLRKTLINGGPKKRQAGRIPENTEHFCHGRRQDDIFIQRIPKEQAVQTESGYLESAMSPSRS